VTTLKDTRERMSDSVTTTHPKRLKEAATGCDNDNIEKPAQETPSSRVDTVYAIQMGLAKRIKVAAERSGRADAFVLGLVMSAKAMAREAGVFPHIFQKAPLGTGKR
jgi:methanogenic corrinoid protein MtbC1